MRLHIGALLTLRSSSLENLSIKEVEEMPRVLVDADSVNAKGTTVVGEAITKDGAEFYNDGAVRILLVNVTESSATITIPTPMKIDGDLEVDEREYTLAAGEIIIAGPFSRQIYNQAEDKVYIDADDANSRDVEVTVFR